MKKMIIAGILCIAVILCMGVWILREPLIFRKSYIERIGRIELPESAVIVYYRFGFNLYGIEPFFAKVQIDRDTYEALIKRLVSDADPSFEQDVLARAKRHRHYNLLNVDNIESLMVNELLTSRCLLGIACTTRVVNIIYVKEAEGYYFIYVFY